MENHFHRTIFIDIETAGLDKEPIIEVAAVAVESATYRVIDTIDMKLEFEMRYISSYKALGVNKFSAEEWGRYAIPRDVAARKLSLFFRRHATVEKVGKKSGKEYLIPKLAGHNSNAFDAPRIRDWFDEHDEFFHPAMLRTLDTEQKARWFFEDNPQVREPENYQLGTLIKHFGLPSNPDHSALNDTLATVDLAHALAEATIHLASTKAA